MTQVAFVNPLTGAVTMQDSNEAQVAYGADAKGNYLGVVPLASAAFILTGPAPSDAATGKVLFSAALKRWAPA